MKRQLVVKLSVVVALIICFMMPVASAKEMSLDYFMDTLNRLQGVWYDLDGNPKYTFDKGTIKSTKSTANPFKILSIEDVTGGYSDFDAKLQLRFGDLKMPIKIRVQNLSKDPSEYHQYLVFLDGTYRRFEQERYYESVGGIYLGMPRHKVIELYGQPDVEKENKIGYTKLGLLLSINYSMVTDITIYAYGDRKFDRSGLGAANSEEEFINAYGTEMLPQSDSLKAIGHSEYLWFHSNPKSVTLSLYWN